MRHPFPLRLSTWLSAGLVALAAPCAQATAITYHADLSGAKEVPVNASTATGFTTVVVDDLALTMRVLVEFSGLTAPNTAAHIHCCTANPFDLTQTAPVATVTPTFPGFPAGTAGVYDHTFDMTLASSYRAGFITAHGGTVSTAWSALLDGLAQGQAYLNIHTATFPGGEIRGFLQVPEPATGALLAVALMGLAAAPRRRPAARR